MIIHRNRFMDSRKDSRKDCFVCHGACTLTAGSGWVLCGCTGKPIMDEVELGMAVCAGCLKLIQRDAENNYVTKDAMTMKQLSVLEHRAPPPGDEPYCLCIRCMSLLVSSISQDEENRITQAQE